MKKLIIFLMMLIAFTGCAPTKEEPKKVEIKVEHRDTPYVSNSNENNFIDTNPSKSEDKKEQDDLTETKPEVDVKVEEPKVEEVKNEDKKPEVNTEDDKDSKDNIEDDQKDDKTIEEKPEVKPEKPKEVVVEKPVEKPIEKPVVEKEDPDKPKEETPETKPEEPKEEPKEEPEEVVVEKPVEDKKPKYLPNHIYHGDANVPFLDIGIDNYDAERTQRYIDAGNIISTVTKFHPNDSEITYFAGHTYNFNGVQHLDLGSVVTVSDNEGNGFKYKIVDFKKYPAGTVENQAPFIGGYHLLDLAGSGIGKESIVIQYCDEFDVPIIYFGLPM